MSILFLCCRLNSILIRYDNKLGLNWAKFSKTGTQQNQLMSAKLWKTAIWGCFSNRIVLWLLWCSLGLCCHRLILILIKTRIDNIFGLKPPHHPLGTQLCLILTKLLTFEVNHENKSCLSILEESKNDVRLSWC